MLQDVVAVVGEQVAAFELGVLAEVFGLDRSSAGLPCYDFAVVAVRPGLVATTSGYSVQVQHGLQRLARADLIAVPSWTTTDSPVAPELAAALHEAVDRGARVLSICSGAFLLAAVGLLNGRRATTHWQYARTLADRYPLVQVDDGGLYVDTGQVITSAGTAAGIDACLYLVRAEHGAAVANALARRMVVAPHRSGGQAQFVEAPVPAADGTDLAALLDWARAHLAEPLTVADLARRAHMSQRTFARRFTAGTGTTPHRWLLDQRLAHAEHLLQTSDLTIEAIAGRCGLGSSDTLRHQFALRRRTSPQAYRRSFHSNPAPSTARSAEKAGPG